MLIVQEKKFFKKERNHLPWVTTTYKYQHKKGKKKGKKKGNNKIILSFLALGVYLHIRVP